MNKYGVENFIIEELEYIKDDNKLSEREIYWINELQTYGRNATKGGDGTILYDHNEIVELYNLGYSTRQIASKLNCDISTIQKVLKASNLEDYLIQQISLTLREIIYKHLTPSRTMGCRKRTFKKQTS